MKASQVAANPYRAAALIDQLTAALEDLFKAAEGRTDKVALEAAKLALVAATLLGS